MVETIPTLTKGSDMNTNTNTNNVLAVLDSAYIAGLSPLNDRVQKARAVVVELIALRDQVAKMNPDAGEIEAGMLAQLVSDARRIGGDA